MLCTAWGCGGIKVLPLSVVFPVRCISSVSPKFYFRKHTFCFLPLVAILESPHCFFFIHVYEVIECFLQFTFSGLDFYKIFILCLCQNGHLSVFDVFHFINFCSYTFEMSLLCQNPIQSLGTE
jgi:hypothetical protein